MKMLPPKINFYIVTSIVFISFHLFLLNFYPIPIIDVEELEYGEFAFSFLHDFTNISDIYHFLFIPKEGSQILLAPFVAPFFYFFGPSLFSLKLSGIVFTLIFIFTWVNVLKKIYPNISLWSLSLFFAIPLPILQIASLSVYSMMTHLGATTWLGILILLVLKISLYKGKTKKALVIIVSLLINIGIFYHPTLIALTPGILFLLIKNQVFYTGYFLLSFTFFSIIPYLNLSTDNDLKAYLRKDNAPTIFILLLLIFATPHLVQGIRKYLTQFFNYKRESLFLFTLLIALVSLLSFVDKELVFYIGLSLIDLFKKLQYFSDIQIPSLRTFDYEEGGGTYHLPGGAFLYISCIVLAYTSVTNRLNIKELIHNKIIQAVFISSMSMLLALSLTVQSGEVLINSIDGMRYFVTLIPLFSIIFFFPFPSLKRSAQRYYLLSFILLNCMGALAFIYPFKQANFLYQARGYLGTFPLFVESVDQQQLLQSPISESLIPWYGTRTYYLKGISGAQKVTSILSREKDVLLFWIGVGMGQNIAALKGEFSSNSKGNCLSEENYCPLDTIEDEVVKDAIKTGWLLATPCTALSKALLQWPRVVSDIQKVLWSKPDFWECYEYFNWNLVSKVQESSLKKSHRAFDSLFPLKATQFMPQTPSGNTLEDYSIYIGWIWLEYVAMQPGEATLRLPVLFKSPQ